MRVWRVFADSGDGTPAHPEPERTTVDFTTNLIHVSSRELTLPSNIRHAGAVTDEL